MNPVYGQQGRIIGYNFSDVEFDIEGYEEILGRRIHYMVDSDTDELTYISIEAQEQSLIEAKTIIQRYRLNK